MQQRVSSAFRVLLIGCVALVASAASNERLCRGDENSSTQPAKTEKSERIDFTRARALLQKLRAGEKLTEDEQKYLDRARAARNQQAGRNPRPNRGPAAPADRKSFASLVPLTEMAADDSYKGEDGGLYGGGKNVPPEAHATAAAREAAKIEPLDAAGKPSPDGRIVMISVGMSNTTQEFSRFMQLAGADAEKSPRLVIVDGAQGGQEAFDWANADKRVRQDRPSPWEVLDGRLKQAGVTAEQVQVVWIKQARRNPASLGEFPKHADELKGHLVRILNLLKERFPNLRIAYVSSRIYAGYARSGLNPEPYAYESAFSVRQLIQDQIKGAASLNYDPARGPVRAPLVLWGPYLWGNGETPREADKLVWTVEDFAADGTHPSDSGRQKVAEMLLGFFKTDPTAKRWFLN